MLVVLVDQSCYEDKMKYCMQNIFSVMYAKVTLSLTYPYVHLKTVKDTCLSIFKNVFQHRHSPTTQEKCVTVKVVKLRYADLSVRLFQR
jgi:hypothetical protein